MSIFDMRRRIFPAKYLNKRETCFLQEHENVFFKFLPQRRLTYLCHMGPSYQKLTVAPQQTPLTHVQLKNTLEKEILSEPITLLLFIQSDTINVGNCDVQHKPLLHLIT